MNYLALALYVVALLVFVYDYSYTRRLKTYYANGDQEAKDEITLTDKGKVDSLLKRLGLLILVQLALLIGYATAWLWTPSAFVPAVGIFGTWLGLSMIFRRDYLLGVPVVGLSAAVLFAGDWNLYHSLSFIAVAIAVAYVGRKRRIARAALKGETIQPPKGIKGAISQSFGAK